MPRPELTALRDELLRAGVAPQHVHRAVTELDDHFEDLLLEQLANGATRAAAERVACRQLGRLDVVAKEMLANPDLRSWAWRWPKVALIVYPIACVAALPAAPLVAGLQHRDSVARWLAGLLLAGLFTAAMFLVLQLAITMPGSGLPR